MTSYSFNYPLMQLLCEELQQHAANFKVVNCLPNDSRRFFIILSGQEHQEALFFCFTPPFLRFHLSSLTSVPKNSSSHPLWGVLQGATLKNVALLQQDRILQLTFATSQGERLFIAEFFSKHPNYYLVQADGKILFALHSLDHSHYQLPPPHLFVAETPLWSTHREVEHAYTNLEKQKEFAQEKQALHTYLAKQLKKLKHKEQELLQQLKNCAEWPHIQHEGELIKFHFPTLKKGLSSLTVQDWTTDQAYLLTLDPAKTPQEEMAQRFRQARKLQAGFIPLQHYLEQIHKKFQQIEQQQQQLALTQTIQELASFKASLASIPSRCPLASKPAAPQPIYREYQSAQGIKIWVGKNAKANQRLTFQLANGRDWWLHIRGCPGSHVVIRLAKNQEPDHETVQDALQLALYYSKAREQGEGEVCFTQRKYVSKLGNGKAGSVQISKHQTAWIRFDPARYQALKQRLNQPV